MRLKELLGLPVVDPTAARKVGTVIDYLVDPTSGRIAAVDVTRKEGDETERIPADRVRRVGRHAVVLTGRSVESTTTALPEDAERWLDTASLTGLEVLGDDGNRIGHLLDARFDQDSLEIQTFLLRATFWERLLGQRGQITPDKVHSCSRELMIVATGRLKEAAPAPTPSSPELGVPLKVEDRLATSSYAGSEDGQPASTRSEYGDSVTR